MRVDTQTPTPTDGTAPRIRLKAVLPPMLACLCVGTVFGSTQTALTAINAARGTDAYTGIIYGFMGLGSAVASVLVSRFPERVPLAWRVAGGALLVVLVSVLLLPVPGSVGLALLFTVIGLGVGSILVSAYTRSPRV